MLNPFVYNDLIACVEQRIAEHIAVAKETVSEEAEEVNERVADVIVVDNDDSDDGVTTQTEALAPAPERLLQLFTSLRLRGEKRRERTDDRQL